MLFDFEPIAKYKNTVITRELAIELRVHFIVYQLKGEQIAGSIKHLTN